MKFKKQELGESLAAGGAIFNLKKQQFTQILYYVSAWIKAWSNSHQVVGYVVSSGKYTPDNLMSYLLQK